MISLFIFAANGIVTGNAVQYASAPETAQTVSAQIVQMAMQNGDYILSPARVKVGEPVRLVGNMDSIRGCYTTVVIPGLNIRKTLLSSDNIIEFTPTKTGTFQMTCGMGMAGGQIVVE